MIHAPETRSSNEFSINTSSMKRTGEVHGLASVNRAQDLVFVLGLNTRRDVWPIIHIGQTPTN